MASADKNTFGLRRASGARSGSLPAYGRNGTKHFRAIIAPSYAPRSRHKTGALRDSVAAGSRRDGRGVSGVGHEARAHGGHQDSSRAVLLGSSSQAAFPARSENHLQPESSAHLRAV